MAKPKRRREVKVVKIFLMALYVVVWIFLILAALGLRLNSMKVTDSSRVNSGVSVMNIELNGVTLSEIQENGKDIKYEGNTVVLGNKEYKGVEVKGRGNFSWAADKKSYRLKFANKVELLGMGKVRKWALITNGEDESLLRNDLAYYLTEIVTGKKYPFRGEFVDLVIDGEDLGLYYLTKTMSIGKQTVSLKDPMGVLVELDNAYCLDNENWYETSSGNCLTMKAVVSDDNAEVAMEDFLGDFNELEKAAEEGDYETAEKMVDMESLAEYFIISELTADPDAYVTSWYFYKDGLEDKIHAGLTWDFDKSFGNRKWDGWPDDFYSPRSTMVRFEYTFGINEGLINKFCNYNDDIIISDSVKVSRIVCKMMDNNEFRELVRDIYQDRVVGKEKKIVNYIYRQVKDIWRAAKHDEEIWQKDDFEEEVKYLKWWISERMEFFKEKYVDNFGESTEIFWLDDVNE